MNDDSAGEILKGRNRLLQLRAQRRGYTRKGDGRSKLHDATHVAAFDLASAMSQAQVDKYVREKRKEYAERHSGVVADDNHSSPKRQKKAAASTQNNSEASMHSVDEVSEASIDGDTDEDYVPDVVSPPSDLTYSDSDESSNDKRAAAARAYFGISDSSGEESTIQEGNHASTRITGPDKVRMKITETKPTTSIPEHDGSDHLSTQYNSFGRLSQSCQDFLSGFPSRWLSWESFHAELKLFSARTRQRFITRSTSSVKRRNEQISDPARYFPAKWRQYCKTLLCTHGLAQNARGKGQRQHQSVRYTGCTAKINATLSRIGRRYYVFVRSSGKHNYPLSSELWDFYAENRQVHDPALLETVGDMHTAGSSAKGILAWLRKKTGKKTKLKDVHNIVQQLKASSHGSTTDAERTETILQEFSSQDDGNTARIFVDEARGVAVAVVFQTAGMKRLFAAFPEVLMVDTTHNTNSNAYKLFSLVVHDYFGKGQYVQHSLVERETQDNLRLVLNAFKLSNPEYKNVKVIVTDKAFHEKAVLAEVFTHARQLLCPFHGQQWFARQVAKLVRGNKEVRSMIEASMAQLIDSRSATEYEDQKALLLDLLGGEEEHPLYASFIANWDNMQDEWVAYLRGNIPHLRNHTNNRLESKWGKLKQLISAAYGIDEVVSTLIMMQEWAEDEYIEEFNKTGSRPPVVEHPELSTLAVAISKYAFDIVADEFRYAIGGRAQYDVKSARDGKVTLRSLRTKNNHVLDTKACQCDCIFAKTLLLPCRHVLYFRKVNNNETVLPPFSLLNRRWLRSHPANDIRTGSIQRGNFECHNVCAPEPVTPLRQDRKYAQAKQTADSIVAAMSRQPTPLFQAALRWLNEFDKALHNGTMENFTGVVANTTGDSFTKQFPLLASQEGQAKQNTRLKRKDIVSVVVQHDAGVATSADSAEVETETSKSSISLSTTTSNGSRQVIGPQPFKFTKPVNNKKLSRTAVHKIARAQLKVGLRKVAGLCGSGKEMSVVTAPEMNILLSGGYSYEKVAQAMTGFNLPVCEVSQQAGVRLMEKGEQVTLHAVDKLLPLDKALHALSILHLRGVSSSEKLVASWPEYSCVSHEMLSFMVRYGEAKLHVDAVEHTTQWIQAVSWTGLQLKEVPAIVHGLEMKQKDAIIIEVKRLNLCVAAVGREAIDGYRLLSFRHYQWLSTTAMLTSMQALAAKYGNVGVVSPSFTEQSEPDQQRKVANAYKAFSPVKKDIIGVLNICGSHWIAYHIDATSRACRLFDPQQSDDAYTKLKSTLQEIVEPLLPIGAELTYYRYGSCLQQDSDNCGLWCLLVLELTVQSIPWNEAMYALVPYLRLRYLDMCLRFIASIRIRTP